MKPLTRASDVFSLAVVCYEVLTRRQPFLASTEDATVDAIQHLNPPPASSLNPNVSVSIGQVICKGMAKDPGHRFASVKEFSEYLRRAHHDDSLLVFDPDKFARVWTRPPRLVNELESEGYQTQELESLATDIKSATRKRSVDRMLESARAGAGRRVSAGVAEGE